MRIGLVSCPTAAREGCCFSYQWPGHDGKARHQLQKDRHFETFKGASRWNGFMMASLRRMIQQPSVEVWSRRTGYF